MTSVRPKFVLFASVCLHVLTTLSAVAQPEKPALTIHSASEGGFNLSWPGEPGNLYIITQSSDDLQSFQILPVLEFSTGGEILWHFETNADRLFFRIKTAPSGTLDPEIAFEGDLDGDGFSNLDEVLAGSDPFNASSVPVVPGSPAEIQAELTSPFSIEVSWSPVAGAASYLLERQTDGGDWVTVAETDHVTFYFLDEGVSTTHIYHYRVTALNSAGSSTSAQTSESGGSGGSGGVNYPDLSNDPHEDWDGDDIANSSDAFPHDPMRWKPLPSYAIIKVEELPSNGSGSLRMNEQGDLLVRTVDTQFIWRSGTKIDLTQEFSITDINDELKMVGNEKISQGSDGNRPNKPMYFASPAAAGIPVGNHPDDFFNHPGYVGGEEEGSLNWDDDYGPSYGARVISNTGKIAGHAADLTTFTPSDSHQFSLPALFVTEGTSVERLTPSYQGLAPGGNVHGGWGSVMDINDEGFWIGIQESAHVTLGSLEALVTRWYLNGELFWTFTDNWSQEGGERQENGELHAVNAANQACGWYWTQASGKVDAVLINDGEKIRIGGGYAYDINDATPLQLIGGNNGPRLYQQADDPENPENFFEYDLQELVSGSLQESWELQSVSQITDSGIIAGRAKKILDDENGPIPEADQKTYAVLLLPIEIEIIHSEIDPRTGVIVSPGKDSVLRDEIVDLRIKIPPFGNEDWTIELDVDPAVMRTQQLGTRGDVLMFDFGTVEDQTVTSLTTDEDRRTVATPYEIVLKAEDDGEATIKAVFNREGALRIRLKSSNGLIDTLSQEITVKNRIRKFALFTAYPNRDPNQYDMAFEDAAEHWKEVYQHEIDSVDRLKGMGMAESYLGANPTAPQSRPDDILTIGNPGDNVLNTLTNVPPYDQFPPGGLALREVVIPNSTKMLSYPDAAASPAATAILYGTCWLYQKASRISNNPEPPPHFIPGTWRTWDDATERYNGGGVPNYLQRVHRPLYEGRDPFTPSNTLWPRLTNDQPRREPSQ